MAKIVGPVKDADVPGWGNHRVGNPLYPKLDAALWGLKANEWLKIDCADQREANNIMSSYYGLRRDKIEGKRRGTVVYIRLRSKVTEKLVDFKIKASRG